jgi:threonine aldolase
MAHPAVLEALSAVGNTQFGSYGLDEYSMRATELVKSTVKKPSADVHFIAGGTHANLVLISSALRPHEAVIAPQSGHIFVHETGAIEATGHKVCTVKGNNGKLCADDINAVVAEHCDEHMVIPRLVYVSLSAESGTVYTKAELTAVSDCCRKNNLYLYLDGARLCAAINSPACDLTYSDIADLADAFYMGGTKNGAMFGEAIIICTDELKPDFRHLLKQRGAMLAKGAAIGIQFEALLKNGLYDELALRAVTLGLKLADGIKNSGYDFLYPPETNLLVPVFPSKVAERLHQLYDFYDWDWQKPGDTTAVRIVTSWATPEYIIDQFLTGLAGI